MRVDKAKEMAEAHWQYVESVLVAHTEVAHVIERCKLHYISAFIHGYKHGVESVG